MRFWAGGHLGPDSKGGLFQVYGPINLCEFGGVAVVSQHKAMHHRYQLHGQRFPHWGSIFGARKSSNKVLLFHSRGDLL